MGETGPLLFKLPQLLFQLFHRLGERTFARVLTRCAGFSVISQSVKSQLNANYGDWDKK
jgi:hypothetical protein